MHKVNLSKYNLRTDLIIENNLQNIKNKHYIKNGIEVVDILLEKDNELKRKKGKYVTISFDDVTDSTSYSNVVSVFFNELKKVLKYLNLKKSNNCLVIGLGNHNIISDALGANVLDNIIVTRHLYEIGNVDKKYRNVAILEPSVMGVTGIDSFDVVKSVINTIKPDFILAIDSLCASNIERLNKVIQISSSGITPGSGIGNTRKELSLDTLNIPVIAIGVPTVVDSAVIVCNSLKLLIKKIGYLKKNIDSNTDKLKNPNKINYLKKENELEEHEKKDLLGYIGLLNEDELQKLMLEVLNPVNANMIVTPKEIDFIMEKMGKLIAEGINKALHNI